MRAGGLDVERGAAEAGAAADAEGAAEGAAEATGGAAVTKADAVGGSGDAAAADGAAAGARPRTNHVVPPAMPALDEGDHRDPPRDRRPARAPLPRARGGAERRERVGELARAAEPARGIVLQAPAHDALERLGPHAGAAVGAGPELAGQELVQDDAEGPDVGARVDVARRSAAARATCSRASP